MVTSEAAGTQKIPTELFPCHGRDMYCQYYNPSVENDAICIITSGKKAIVNMGQTLLTFPEQWFPIFGPPDVPLLRTSSQRGPLSGIQRAEVENT